MIKQFHETARNAGRGQLDVVLRAFSMIFDQSMGSERKPMMGTLDELKEDIARLGDMGVTHLIHSPPSLGFTMSPSVDEGLLAMERLIEISR
jgi:hypothetical protein